MPSSDASSPAKPSPLEQLFQLAGEHHRAGRLQEAGGLYQVMLKALPNHPEVNYRLGLLALQLNHAVGAAHYFKTALEANPNHRHYWTSYIDTLIHVGRSDLARHTLSLGRQQGLQGEDIDALAARAVEKPSERSAPAAVPSNHAAAKPSKKSARNKKK